MHVLGHEPLWLLDSPLVMAIRVIVLRPMRLIVDFMDTDTLILADKIDIMIPVQESVAPFTNILLTVLTEEVENLWGSLAISLEDRVYLLHFDVPDPVLVFEVLQSEDQMEDREKLVLKGKVGLFVDVLFGSDQDVGEQRELLLDLFHLHIPFDEIVCLHIELSEALDFSHHLAERVECNGRELGHPTVDADYEVTLFIHTHEVDQLIDNLCNLGEVLESIGLIQKHLQA